MIDVKAIRDRKKVRMEILTKLYNHNFYSPTQNNYLIAKMNELIGERNSEKHLAYHYLVESGYIEIENMDDYSTVRITAKGINYVESIFDHN